jgi:hypothetical protein
MHSEVTYIRLMGYENGNACGLGSVGLFEKGTSLLRETKPLVKCLIPFYNAWGLK